MCALLTKQVLGSVLYVCFTDNNHITNHCMHAQTVCLFLLSVDAAWERGYTVLPSLISRPWVWPWYKAKIPPSLDVSLTCVVAWKRYLRCVEMRHFPHLYPHLPRFEWECATCSWAVHVVLAKDPWEMPRSGHTMTGRRFQTPLELKTWTATVPIHLLAAPNWSWTWDWR